MRRALRYLPFFFVVLALFPSIAWAETLAPAPSPQTDLASGAGTSGGLLPPDYLVPVKGGSFRMGTRHWGDKDEYPVHRVKVSAFLIGRFEVSQALWKAVMGTEPSHFRGDTLPVEAVTWLEAVEFCNALSLREGLSPAYTIAGSDVACDWDSEGFRLPTEAEWEYAARGGPGMSQRKYLWAGSNKPDEVAWTATYEAAKTRPIGAKLPNKLGLYDMSGNVAEWCWDRYGPYGKKAQRDPRGPEEGEDRVLRGGSFGAAGWAARVSERSYTFPSERAGGLGFRIARGR